jgi:hypothetical protein
MLSLLVAAFLAQYRADHRAARVVHLVIFAVYLFLTIVP